MRKQPDVFAGGFVSKGLAIVVILAMNAAWPHMSCGFDGFNVSSSTFANQYNGNQIWDGTNFQNDWTQAGGADTAALSLSGASLVVTNRNSGLPAGNNGWLQHDSGTSPWELGTGNWTLELSAKVNEATAAPDNFVLWTALGGSQLIVRIAQNSVGYNQAGADLVSGVMNDDAFHTFRVAYDATDLTAGPNGTYHVWRDSVPISGVGVARTAADTTDRLIIGDCCSGIGNPVDPFEIQYVRYDMGGAFSPIAAQGALALEIDRNSGAMTFRNTTGAALTNIIGYTITSDAGSLNPTTWDKQSTGTNLSNDNDQWMVLTSSSNELAEVVLDSTGADNGGDVPATSGSWSFGSTWRKSPLEDVVMEILLDDGSILSQAAGDFTISYTGNGGSPFATGDLDFDGDLDPADWAAFKTKFHGSNLTVVGTPASHQAELYNLGDLNIDGQYTLADFNAFEAAYDAVNGAGAFAAIPEPATSTLLVICGTTAMMLRRGKGKRHVGRLAAVLAIAGGALFGPQRSADAQTATITNPGTAAAGDKANTAGFAFRADAGTFPASVSPPGSLTDLFLMESITLKRPDDATTPSFGTAVRQTTSATTPIFLDVYSSLDGGTNVFSGYVGSSSSSIAWADTTQNTNYSFDFSDLLLNKSSKYWFVFSEDAVAGEVSNFRHRVATGGSNTGTGDNASGYLLNDAAQVHTQGAGESDWGTEYVVEFAPVTPLTLQVNITTGAASIMNDGSPLNFDVNSYSITSDNSLATGGWNSLEDQVIGGDPTPGNKDNGDSWEEFNNISSSFIGEGFLTGSTTVLDGNPLALGSIFSPGGTQDLSFTYTATNGGIPGGGLVTGMVEYVSGGGFAADFDNDGDVDGNDLTEWKGDFGPAAGSDADNDGDSDGNDFLVWQRQLGSTSSTAAAAAVPEPSGAMLALLAASLVAARRLRKFAIALAATVCCAVLSNAQPASAEVFNDRHYSLGDLSNIGYDTQGVDASAFPGAVDSGAFQDLIIHGGVTSTNVGAGGLNRPGLTTAANGAAFDGVDDALTTAVSLNSPNHTYNTAAFFPMALIPPDAADDGLYDPPSAAGADGPDPDTSYTPAFPHNYATIFSRGIQLWARPTGLGQARRQDLVMDSLQHGVFITENDTWGLQFDGPPVPARDNGSIDSGVPVASTLDANGWVHVMELSGADDPVGGGSAFGGALLVNGVAVAASNTFFDPDTTGFSIGSNQAHDNNFYAGAIDEVRVFLWGDNSDRDPDVNTSLGYLGGANWGALNLAEDNDWIKQKLASLNVTSPGDVDLNGAINAADATAFVTHWRKVFTVDGLQVGDWNSRQQGDLDFSGDVDLADAFIAHAALDAVGLALNFELLSAAVPEPSSALLALGAAGITALRSRRTRKKAASA